MFSDRKARLGFRPATGWPGYAGSTAGSAESCAVTRTPAPEIWSTSRTNKLGKIPDGDGWRGRVRNLSGRSTQPA